MELIDYTNNWVRGEVFQGKVMIGLGILILVAGISIFRSDHEFLRGMLIPLGLILLILIGYGGMQVVVRPNHVEKVQTLMEQSEEKAIDQEYQKAVKDNKAYSTLKPVWAVLIVVSVVLYFIFSTLYLKGLSIGIMGLFMTLLTLDSILQYRLDIYFTALKELAN